MSKINIPDLEPSPHYAIFKKHGIKPAQVARAIGYSYCHTNNILLGYTLAKPEVRRKLDALVDQLEGRI